MSCISRAAASVMCIAGFVIGVVPVPQPRAHLADLLPLPRPDVLAQREQLAAHRLVAAHLRHVNRHRVVVDHVCHEHDLEPGPRAVDSRLARRCGQCKPDENDEDASRRMSVAYRGPGATTSSRGAGNDRVDDSPRLPGGMIARAASLCRSFSYVT